MKSNRKFLPAVRRFLEDLIAPYEKDRELAKVFCREFLFHRGEVRAELDKQASEILRALAEVITVAQKRGDIDKRVDPSVGACNSTPSSIRRWHSTSQIVFRANLRVSL